MANIMENKPFLLFVAIMQPVIYFISLQCQEWGGLSRTIFRWCTEVFQEKIGNQGL